MASIAAASIVAVQWCATEYRRRRPGYVYRRGYGWGPAAVGLGVLGAAAVGAAAAGAYGYADPCLRQQQVYDVYGNVVWQTVRVC